MSSHRLLRTWLRLTVASLTLGQISKWDYFHPNVDGQNVLAAITYRVGFGW